MTSKRFFVSFSALAGTTAFLYMIGHALSIPWLMFSFEFVNHAGEFSVTAGSFVPLLIGLAASLLAEIIYVRKQRSQPV